jgi:hypothetical protein
VGIFNFNWYYLSSPPQILRAPEPPPLKQGTDILVWEYLTGTGTRTGIVFISTRLLRSCVVECPPLNERGWYNALYINKYSYYHIIHAPLLYCTVRPLVRAIGLRLLFLQQQLLRTQYCNFRFLVLINISFLLTVT